MLAIGPSRANLLLLRESPVAFDPPKFESAADALAAPGAVLESCPAGTLSPAEAAIVMDLIATHLRAIVGADPLFCLKSPDYDG